MYPDVLPPLEYPNHFIVKRVANALMQHPIGLEEVADGIWSITFCRVLLGRIDERDYIIRA